MDKDDSDVGGARCGNGNGDGVDDARVNVDVKGGRLYIVEVVYKKEGRMSFLL